ncbi:MAG: exonuclease [Desulfobacteraceae bacterium]|nr:MAG: exonuclease [Desulfobacteraceae bacterium]
MGLLSATTSAVRYRVDGQVEHPVLETIAQGLKKGVITDIDNQPSEQTAGWTSFRNPFEPDFEGSSFLVGTYILFSLRIDKKTIPPKLLQKHFSAESAQRLKALDREFLSNEEKKGLKDQIILRLNQKMPATPNIYDVVWQYEKGLLWFFSTLKSANELLETLFFKSFGLHLIRMIPYTMALFNPEITGAQRDALEKLAFAENGDG